MKNERLTYIQNILFPGLLFSAITGILTGGAVFAFRFCSGYVVSFSERIYASVRAEPRFLPLLLLGAAVLGLLTALVLHFVKSCRGGGIPTAIALVRGLIGFRWLHSIFTLFATAMSSFLCGLPLGSEGPCVQMGTAVGSGTVRIFAKRHRAWERYMMTGGACAGFAAATGAPISGIFFAFEEAHRRFSPMLFMSAAMSVLTGSVTTQLLCRLSGTEFSMFGHLVDTVLPVRYFWAAVLVGLASGICAILFTKLYRVVGRFLSGRIAKLHFIPRLSIVFAAVALMGFLSSSLVGSGHHIIDELLVGKGIWYLLFLYLLVRAVTLCFANQAGATGGLFIPSLAFGAMIGSLSGSALTACRLLPEEYQAVMVVIGMASFLAASSRTPITALSFSAEALCGFSGILPVMVGVTISFLVIETAGVTAFNETVIESHVEAEHRGKTAQVVDTHLTVQPGSFVIGKEIRDILWPPACVILSVKRAPDHIPGADAMDSGDILHVRYQTYDPPMTAKCMEDLLGAQPADPLAHTFTTDGHLPEQ